MAPWTERIDLLSPTATLAASADPSLDHMTLALRVPAATAILRGVRGAVRAWLDTVEEPAGSWDVIVTELVANAINASPAGGHVTVAMHLSSGHQTYESSVPRVVCTVTNDGTWELPSMKPPVPLDLLLARSAHADLSSPAGRGLRIVSALTSGGEIVVGESETIVGVWLDRGADVWYAGGSGSS